MHYFRQLPKIQYSNSSCLNVMARAGVASKAFSNPYLFYPYDVATAERADNLANRYYGDPYESWLLYYSNQVVDPYYDWYLSPEEFEEFIIAKYGSTAKAQSLVLRYRSNWFADERVLDEAGYGALAPEETPYWASNGRGGWTRASIDLFCSTDRTVSLTANSSGFIVGERVDVYFSDDHRGYAQVADATGNQLIIQHTFGTVTSNSEVLVTDTCYVYGNESRANVAFTAASLIVENLSNTVVSYYVAENCYDYERAKNDANRSIRVMGSEYQGMANRQLQAAMGK